jgi:3-deoxy-D-manno-octulosonate 8-phosphate phosphatase (KDO 8-P phosphatase)
MNEVLHAKLKSIQLVVFDVDGVLTDGKIYHTAQGDEIKAFHVHDGLGIRLLHQANIQTAIITSRQSSVVDIRAKELNIQHVYQGQKNKRLAFQDLCKKCQCDPSTVAYVGDDLPDLPLIISAGVGIAVANATTVIKEHADWVTHKKGGKGAVREIAETLLKIKELYDQLLEQYR